MMVGHGTIFGSMTVTSWLGSAAMIPTPVLVLRRSFANCCMSVRSPSIVGGVAAATLSVGEAEWAVESGIATEGMATKLRAALDALKRGVPQVRIGGLDALLDSTLGTTLVGAPQLA